MNSKLPTYFHVTLPNGGHHMGLFKQRDEAVLVARQLKGKVVTCFDMPDNLDEKGRQAHKVIVEFLTERGLTYTGGCLTFYSPKEWRARHESYGCDSHLIVVYDGSEVAKAFSMDYCYARMSGPNCYRHYEAMQDKLEEIGLRFDECTNWFSAVYS